MEPNIRTNTVTKTLNKRPWRNKNPKITTLFSLTLAALKNPQSPSSKTLILNSLNNFLHLLRRKSPLPSESLVTPILSLLPPLLHSNDEEITCMAVKIVGAMSLVSIELNERIACDTGILKGLVWNILRAEKMVTKKSVCNAVLDLSITSLGCQKLLQVSALNYLMLGFVQVQKSMATSIYIKTLKSDNDVFLGIDQKEDETTLLLLNATATLTNICNKKQLTNIPMRLKEAIFPYLREIWSNVHEQLLASTILNFSELKHCYMSNLTVQNLAESIFRLHMDLPTLTYSIPSKDIMGHLFRPFSSGFEGFVSDHWELSPFLVKAQPKDPNGPHVFFSSFMNLLICEEEAVPRFLSSILRGMVSCSPLAIDEIDSLGFLNDVRETLGFPVMYQQDLRVVRTNLHSKLQEHYFQESSSNGIELPRFLCADDIFKVEEAYGEGYTVALRGMQFRSNSIAAFTREIAFLFGQPSVGANLYVTPPNSQGLSCHYDDHCVFVCQLFGEKKWTVSSQPVVQLPRLYDSLKGPQDSPVERRQILLREGDVLYLPRGFAHEACTTTDVGSSDNVFGSSIHLTLAIEVEPPFEWEGFAHVALHRWSRDKCSDIIDSGSFGKFLAISVNILHVAIRLISSTETILRKACLVAASSLPRETEDWLDKNQKTIFDLILYKINELSNFTDSLNFLQMAIQRDEDPFHWVRWLEHLDGGEVIVDNGFITFDGIHEMLPFIHQCRDDVEAAFALVKSKFCNDVRFDDVKESYKSLYDMYKDARMQYMNGMLSLHNQSNML